MSATLVLALLGGCAPAASATPPAAPVCTGEHLSRWSTSRLAQQTIVVPVDEGDVAAARAEVAAGAGGLILYGNAAPPDLGVQLRMLEASAPDGIVPFVMADEEGGEVQRMADVTGGLPSAREMAATMTAAEISRAAAKAGARMRAAGVTMDLAPVLDIDGGAGPNDRDADGTRSFSADPAIAWSDGSAFAAGLTSSGVVPVVKHFPGLGGATGNTDVTAAATPPWTVVQQAGLVPFEDAVAAGAAAVMVANATVPGLSTLPASISPAVITGVLRERLGFHGLVMTDSVSAAALQQAGYSVPRAAVAALEAGADMILFNADAAHVAAVTDQVVTAIAGAVASGALSQSLLAAAVEHVLTAKHVAWCASA